VAELVKRRWEANLAGGSRRQRQGFTYEAFVPDLIASSQPRISFETSALIADADAEIAKLNEDVSVLGFEALGPLLLRSEAVASSRIEKLAVSQLNLARALFDPRAARGSAPLVAANVKAMEQAIGVGDYERPIRADDLAEIHAVLIAPDQDHDDGGSFRDEQNWIGGSSDSPIDAVFIPPPHDLLPPLLDDLVAYLNRADLPPIAQAAVAHAQFETIHPFTDGNGRVGRSLIHLVLRRRGLTPRFVPPVSVVLATRPNSYVAGLTVFREGDVDGWLAAFAAAALQAAAMSLELATAVRDLQATWTEQAGAPRSGSAAERIIRLLPAQPILTAMTGRAALGISHEAARRGLLALEAAGVVRKISSGNWDRTYAAVGLFELIKEYEDGVRGRSVATDDASEPG
jgi:Fic family protein